MKTPSPEPTTNIFGNPKGQLHPDTIKLEADILKTIQSDIFSDPKVSQHFIKTHKLEQVLPAETQNKIQKKIKEEKKDSSEEEEKKKIIIIFQII